MRSAGFAALSANLGALLIALICLGGGLLRLDQLLVPVTASIAGWRSLALGSHQPTTSGLELTSRELAPVAAAVCLAAAPLFQRWSVLVRVLVFAAASGGVLLGTTAASQTAPWC